MVGVGYMSLDVRKTNLCMYKGYLYNDDPGEAQDGCVAKVGCQAGNCMTDTLNKDTRRYPQILVFAVPGSMDDSRETIIHFLQILLMANQGVALW